MGKKGCSLVGRYIFRILHMGLIGSHISITAMGRPWEIFGNIFGEFSGCIIDDMEVYTISVPDFDAAGIDTSSKFSKSYYSGVYLADVDQLFIPEDAGVHHVHVRGYIDVIQNAQMGSVWVRPGTDIVYTPTGIKTYGHTLPMEAVEPVKAQNPWKPKTAAGMKVTYVGDGDLEAWGDADDIEDPSSDTYKDWYSAIYDANLDHLWIAAQPYHHSALIGWLGPNTNFNYVDSISLAYYPDHMDTWHHAQLSDEKEAELESHNPWQAKYAHNEVLAYVPKKAAASVQCRWVYDPELDKAVVMPMNWKDYTSEGWLSHSQLCERYGLDPVNFYGGGVYSDGEDFDIFYWPPQADQEEIDDWRDYIEQQVMLHLPKPKTAAGLKIHNVTDEELQAYDITPYPYGADDKYWISALYFPMKHELFIGPPEAHHQDLINYVQLQGYNAWAAQSVIYTEDEVDAAVGSSATIPLEVEEANPFWQS